MLKCGGPGRMGRAYFKTRLMGLAVKSNTCNAENSKTLKLTDLKCETTHKKQAAMQSPWKLLKFYRTKVDFVLFLSILPCIWLYRGSLLAWHFLSAAIREPVSFAVTGPSVDFFFYF